MSWPRPCQPTRPGGTIQALPHLGCPQTLWRGAEVLWGPGVRAAIPVGGTPSAAGPGWYQGLRSTTQGPPSWDPGRGAVPMGWARLPTQETQSWWAASSAPCCGWGLSPLSPPATCPSPETQDPPLSLSPSRSASVTELWKRQREGSPSPSTDEVTEAGRSGCPRSAGVQETQSPAWHHLALSPRCPSFQEPPVTPWKPGPQPLALASPSGPMLRPFWETGGQALPCPQTLPVLGNWASLAGGAGSVSQLHPALDVTLAWGVGVQGPPNWGQQELEEQLLPKTPDPAGSPHWRARSPRGHRECSPTHVPLTHPVSVPHPAVTQCHVGWGLWHM